MEALPGKSSTTCALKLIWGLEDYRNNNDRFYGTTTYYVKEQALR
jgi:hypothetical protein